jgi:hypothetical protein
VSARVPQGACKYNDVCVLAATSPPQQPEYCILHDPAGKNRRAFDQAIHNHFVAGRCDLHQVRFPQGGGTYTFTGKVFPRTLDLTDAVCLPHLEFQNCQFQGGLLFSAGQFGHITFQEGAINGAFRFDLPNFGSSLSFRSIAIHGPFTLNVTSVHLSANEFKVHGTFSVTARTVAELHLGRTELLDGFSLRAEQVQESRHLQLVILHGVLDWRESTIDGDLHLEHLTLEPGASIDLSGSTLLNGLAFFRRGALPEGIRLDGTNIRGNVLLEAPFGASRLRVIAEDHPPRFAGIVTLKNVDLSECRLLGNTFPRFDISNIAWARRFGRSVLYDEVELRASGDFSALASLREANQWLKQEYQRLGDHVRSGDFHYAEMEAKRRESGWPWRTASWASLYWLVSGYGTDPWRAFGILVILILGSAMGYWAMRPDAFDYSFPEALLFSVRVTLLQRPEMLDAFTFWERLLHTLEGVLGPVQLALFGLALRMRLRR